MRNFNNSNNKNILVASLFCLTSSSVVHAELLTDVIPDLLKSHNEILAAKADKESASFDLKKEEAAWLPSVDLTLNRGNEKQNKPDAADTNYNRYSYDVALKQLITDFGKTDAAISKSEISLRKKTADLAAKEQSVLLDGISSYLQVMTASEKLHYAKQYENNMKKQTGMEETRVKIGSGFSTDVLQSKSKLASAYAKTARAQGAVVKAMNNYKNVFGFPPKETGSFRRPMMPLRYLPKSLEQALEIASTGNPEIISAKYDVETAKKDLRSSESAFYPKLMFKYDGKHKKDDAGSAGVKQEHKYAVELTYPISFGMKDTHARSKSGSDLISKEEKLKDKRSDIEERVRNAWQDLLTDKMNAEHLRNSANISAEFLILARKERKMGKRSLIDVLSEENNYLNSVESAVQAEKDYMVSAFKVLKEIGLLTPDKIVDAQRSSNAQSSTEKDSDKKVVERVQKSIEKSVKDSGAAKPEAVVANMAPNKTEPKANVVQAAKAGASKQVKKPNSPWSLASVENKLGEIARQAKSAGK